jgi:hypothetical protein
MMKLPVQANLESDPDLREIVDRLVEAYQPEPWS